MEIKPNIDKLRNIFDTAYLCKLDINGELIFFWEKNKIGGNNMAEKRLKTYMTQVFFRCPDSEEPIPLKRPKSREFKDSKEVFLFDELLGGGIVIPDDIVKARFKSISGRTPGLLMIVAGPPGSGKTTFALELC